MQDTIVQRREYDFARDFNQSRFAGRLLSGPVRRILGVGISMWRFRCHWSSGLMSNGREDRCHGVASAGSFKDSPFPDYVQFGPRHRNFSHGLPSILVYLAVGRDNRAASPTMLILSSREMLPARLERGRDAGYQALGSGHEGLPGAQKTILSYKAGRGLASGRTWCHS